MRLPQTPEDISYAGYDNTVAANTKKSGRSGPIARDGAGRPRSDAARLAKQFHRRTVTSTVSLAFLDWAAHAANSPFQTAALGGTALAQWQRLAHAAMDGEKAISPPPGDHRFDHPAWQARPYSLLTQAVLLGEEWWDSVVSAPGG